MPPIYIVPTHRQRMAVFCASSGIQIALPGSQALGPLSPLDPRCNAKQTLKCYVCTMCRVQQDSHVSHIDIVLCRMEAISQVGLTTPNTHCGRSLPCLQVYDVSARPSQPHYHRCCTSQKSTRAAKEPQSPTCRHSWGFSTNFVLVHVI